MKKKRRREMLRLKLVTILLLCGVYPWSAAASDSPDSKDQFRRAQVEYRLGHFAAAEALFTGALQLIDPVNDEERAAVLTYLGNIYVGRDELVKAERAYSAALIMYRKQSNRQSTILQLRNLGATYSLEGRQKDALRVLQEALTLTTNETSTDKAITSLVLNSLGVVYYYEGQLRRAEKVFQQALEMMTSQDSTFDLAEILNNLGAVYTDEGRYEKAKQFLERALDTKRSEVGKAHADLTLGLNLLGDLYTRAARYDDAEATYLEAVQILQQYGTQFETRRARVMYALSRTYEAEGRNNEREKVLAEAAAIALRHLPTPSMAEIVSAYAGVLERHGDRHKALELKDSIRRAQVDESLVVTAKGPF
jgi:tetratricopeptide (TPR) repeat protein